MAEHAQGGQAQGGSAQGGQAQGAGGEARPAGPEPEPLDAGPGLPGADRRIAQAAPESAVLARLTLLQRTAGNAAAARLLSVQDSPEDGAP